MKLLVSQLFIMIDKVAVIKPCTGSFEIIHQIPCHHTLRSYASHKRKVTKEDFHQHWHYKSGLPPPRSPSPRPTIFAPHVVRTRGRPRDDQSIRRNPSQFELGETQRGRPRGRPGRVGGETFLVSRFPCLWSVVSSPLSRHQILLKSRALSLFLQALKPLLLSHLQAPKLYGNPYTHKLNVRMMPCLMR